MTEESKSVPKNELKLKTQIIIEETKAQTKSPIAVNQIGKLAIINIDSADTKVEASPSSTPLDTHNISIEKTIETHEKKKQKMVITGDDILIEYVSRIIRHLESLLIVF
jgi:hypothetical protein